jgi:hypothetical protein
MKFMPVEVFLEAAYQSKKIVIPEHNQLDRLSEKLLAHASIKRSFEVSLVVLQGQHPPVCNQREQHQHLLEDWRVAHEAFMVR